MGHFIFVIFVIWYLASICMQHTHTHMDETDKVINDSSHPKCPFPLLLYILYKFDSCKELHDVFFSRHPNGKSLSYVWKSHKRKHHFLFMQYSQLCTFFTLFYWIKLTPNLRSSCVIPCLTSAQSSILPQITHLNTHREDILVSCYIKHQHIPFKYSIKHLMCITSRNGEENHTFWNKRSTIK